MFAELLHFFFCKMLSTSEILRPVCKLNRCIDRVAMVKAVIGLCTSTCCGLCDHMYRAFLFPECNRKMERTLLLGITCCTVYVGIHVVYQCTVYVGMQSSLLWYYVSHPYHGTMSVIPTMVLCQSSLPWYCVSHPYRGLFPFASSSSLSEKELVADTWSTWSAVWAAVSNLTTHPGPGS